MRPSTLTELADRYAITLPPIPGFGSFAVFIDTYTAATPSHQGRSAGITLMG
jgi:hypothetical protein